MGEGRLTAITSYQHNWCLSTEEKKFFETANCKVTFDHFITVQRSTRKGTVLYDLQLVLRQVWLSTGRETYAVFQVSLMFGDTFNSLQTTSSQL